MTEEIVSNHRRTKTDLNVFELPKYRASEGKMENTAR